MTRLEQFANAVQYASLGLESVGLTLAAVDAFRPALRRRAEAKLDRVPLLFRRVWFYAVSTLRSLADPRDHPHKTFPTAVQLQRFLARGTAISVFCVSIAEVIERQRMPPGLGRVWVSLPFVPLAVLAGAAAGVGVYAGVGFAVALPLGAATLLLKLFEQVVTALDRLTGGHAWVGIGLMLAALGFLGECFQVYVLAVSTQAPCPQP